MKSLQMLHRIEVLYYPNFHLNKIWSNLTVQFGREFVQKGSYWPQRRFRKPAAYRSTEDEALEVQTTLLEYGRYSASQLVSTTALYISHSTLYCSAEYFVICVISVCFTMSAFVLACRKGVLVSGGSGSGSGASATNASGPSARARAAGPGGHAASALAAQQLEEEAEAALDPVRCVAPRLAVNRLLCR